MTTPLYHLEPRVSLEAGEKTKLILLAAPAAIDYYPHIGMVRHESCWMTS